jgi:hypothetical protein
MTVQLYTSPPTVFIPEESEPISTAQNKHTNDPTHNLFIYVFAYGYLMMGARGSIVG